MVKLIKYTAARLLHPPDAALVGASPIDIPVLDEEALLEAGRWRKAAAIGLAGLGMMAAPMTGKASAGSETYWKDMIQARWEQLSTLQQQDLDQEEREWVKWKNRLNDSDRWAATKVRANYIAQLADPESGQTAAQVRAAILADASAQLKKKWNDLSPKEQQQFNNYMRQHQNAPWYAKLQAFYSPSLGIQLYGYSGQQLPDAISQSLDQAEADRDALAQAEDDLTDAWKALSPGMRNKLRQEQRKWIHYKDSLSIGKRAEEVSNRASYLISLRTHA
jgi:hypothetical protein